MIDTNRVLKSHISKLAVIELRHECQLAGLPDTGLKVELVQRLLEWATNEVAVKKPNRGTSASSISSKAATTTPSPPPLPATPPPPPPTLAPTTTTLTPTVENCTKNCTNTTIESLLVSAPPDVKVQWLGTSSGAPTSRRNVSSIAVRYGENRVFLVDVGEGTRNQLRIANINPAHITHIFITHLHGDHCFGLPGLLSAINDARKRDSLTTSSSSTTTQQENPGCVYIYGAPEIHRLLLAASKSAGLNIDFPVIATSWVFDPSKVLPPGAKHNTIQFRFQSPDQSKHVPKELLERWQSVYDSGSEKIVRPGLTWSTTIPELNWTVTAAQLVHRVPCWGYVFEEPSVHIQKQDVGEHIVQYWQGKEERTIDEWVRIGRKLVLLGDTCDSISISSIAYGCDVISHEATFEKGKEIKAKIATHSTAEQAGLFARSIRAKNLVLTHFSGRYEMLDKYHRMWVEAKQKGMTMKQLKSTTVQPLAEEARAAFAGPRGGQRAASSPANSRVFLANDFFLFRVMANEPAPANLLTLGKERIHKNGQQMLHALVHGEYESVYGAHGSAYSTFINTYNGGGSSGGGSGGGGVRQKHPQQHRRGGGGGGGGNYASTNSYNSSDDEDRRQVPNRRRGGNQQQYDDGGYVGHRR